jgi:hypothetical protein
MVVDVPVIRGDFDGDRVAGLTEYPSNVGWLGGPVAGGSERVDRLRAFERRSGPESIARSPARCLVGRSDTAARHR